MLLHDESWVFNTVSKWIGKFRFFFFPRKRKQCISKISKLWPFLCCIFKLHHAGSQFLTAGVAYHLKSYQSFTVNVIFEESCFETDIEK